MFVSTPIYDTLVKLDMGAKKPLGGGRFDQNFPLKKAVISCGA
jgi:hypothetical protein